MSCTIDFKRLIHYRLWVSNDWLLNAAGARLNVTLDLGWALITDILQHTAVDTVDTFTQTVIETFLPFRR